MCGRYTLSTPEQALDFLAPVLDEAGVPPALEARFNVAPTQVMPIVANRTTRVVELARWGLVPFEAWKRDPLVYSSPITGGLFTLFLHRLTGERDRVDAS